MKDFLKKCRSKGKRDKTKFVLFVCRLDPGVHKNPGTSRREARNILEVHKIFLQNNKSNMQGLRQG